MIFEVMIRRKRLPSHLFSRWKFQNRRTLFLVIIFQAVVFMGVLPSRPALAASCESLKTPGITFPALALSAPETAAAQAFYAQWKEGCVWTEGTRKDLVAAIEKSSEDGLSPELFHIDLLRSLPQAGNPQSGAETDFALTAAALRYAAVMTRGQVDLNLIEDDVDLPRPWINFAAQLKTALALGQLAPWLGTLPPSAPEYARLKTGLARYRMISAKGGWPVFPAGGTLKLGDPVPDLPVLQVRLMAEGDYVGPLSEPGPQSRYDEETMAAVKRFQRRHGLEADGHLGRKTRAELNVPVSARIEQINLNLARWRSVGHVVPSTRIEVNAAAAIATYIRDNVPQMEMAAVVGARKTPTPMLISEISSIVVNPPWNVPSSITQREMLPKIAADPSYLAKNDMYWTDGRLVQRPGPKSSLGRIKFDFPNKYQVYLHDTPAQALFSGADRARSHGCVRLGRPVDLAAILLASNPSWNRARLEALINNGVTSRVQVSSPMPVFIAYWTAFADPNGDIEFRDDIYGRDQRLMSALSETGRPGQKSASRGAKVCRAA